MYKAETNRWIKIQTTLKGKAFFYHKGKRVPVALVIKCNTPWIGERKFPDHIHGYYAPDYWDPMFVQFNGNGTAVKIWKEA